MGVATSRFDAAAHTEAHRVLETWHKLYAGDSEGFVRDVLGVGPDVWEGEVGKSKQLSGIDPWQLVVLKDYDARERRISIVSGHGVGKSTLLSWLAIHQILFRYPQKTVATAPSSTQLFDALASEMKSWIKRLPPHLQALLEVTSERIEYKPDPEGSFISFRTSRADQPEALAGVHSAWVLLIGDESSGIPDQVFQAASGSMSGENAITILAGNGVRSQGLFFDTHHKLAYRWKHYRVNAEESPRVAADFIEEMKLRYGSDSNAYRVRVLGLFPLADDDTIIGYEVATIALDRDVQAAPTTLCIWGVDVARFGSDKGGLAKRRGNVLAEKTKEWAGYDLMQTAGFIKSEWDDCPPSQRPIQINIDGIGMGAGVADRLRELGLPAFAINVSELPALVQKYLNLKTELWFLARDWFLKRNCNLAGDHKLRDQLTMVRFKYHSSGKEWVETKDDLKRRDKPSPERADAFVLTFASDALTLLGETGFTSWREPQKRNIRGIV